MSRLKHIPIIGNKYRDWTVVDDKIYKKSTNRESYWLVECGCGVKEIRSASHLVKGKTGSCRSCAATVNSFEKSYLNKIKRRAESMNFEFNLDLDYVLSIFDGKCKLSGEDIKFGKHWSKLSEQTASLDRIDSKEGYVVGNVQWVHKDVNFMKGKLTQKRFKELCKLITSMK